MTSWLRCPGSPHSAAPGAHSSAMAYSDTPDPMGRRKAEHLRIAAEEDIETSRAPGWDDVHLVHDALPATDAARIDLSARFLHHTLALPLVIAGMTGGPAAAARVDGP